MDEDCWGGRGEGEGFIDTPLIDETQKKIFCFFFFLIVADELLEET